MFVEASQALIKVPIADVRSSPVAPQPGHADDLEQTQLLFGELVQVLESTGPWRRIRAPQQPAFRYDHHWTGYPGWILASTLSTTTARGMGSPAIVVGKKWLAVAGEPDGTALLQVPAGAQLRVIGHKRDWLRVDLLDGRAGWVPREAVRRSPPPASELRRRIVEVAKLYLGDPYLWGGRSPADPSAAAPLSGIDCSGLVHVSYFANGITVPRDSAEQYLKAEKIKRADLRPGDLVFSSYTTAPEKIVHVGFYLGNEMLLEAPHAGDVVHQISFQDKFGKPMAQVDSGQSVGDRVVYYGRFLKS